MSSQLHLAAQLVLLLLLVAGARAGPLSAALGAEAGRRPPAPLEAARASLACFIGASQCPSTSVSTGPSAGAQRPAGDLQRALGATATARQPSATDRRSHHEPLFPLGWDDAIGLLATTFALVLAASGGVGGGGLLIPIYMLVFGFRAISAVALSNVTIMGGTLINFMFNVGKRHPLRPGPLIDWDLILVMEPSTILGALAGGYINHVLPPWITTVALSLLLAFVTVNLLRRGVATFRIETLRIKRAVRALAQQRPQKQAGDSPSMTVNGSADSATVNLGLPPMPAVAAASSPESQGPSGGSQPVSVTVHVHTEAAGEGLADGDADYETPQASPGQRSELTEPLLGPGRDRVNGVLSPATVGMAAPTEPPAQGRPGLGALQHGRGRSPEVPFAKLAILVALLIGVIISDTIRTRLRCPSVAYWLAAVAMAPVTILVLLGVRQYLIRKHHKRAAAPGFVPAEGEVVWTRRTTIVYPALCTFAGLVAGMFGVGGGIIKGPLMLEMGVHPQVAAATSATMILFTSTAASTVFISFGAVQWDYAGMLFLCALVSTAVGQLGTKWMMRRMHGRSSIIIFAMVTILGCSAVVLGVQGGFVARTAFEQHQAWDWGNVCGASPH